MAHPHTKAPCYPVMPKFRARFDSASWGRIRGIIELNQSTLLEQPISVEQGTNVVIANARTTAPDGTNADQSQPVIQLDACGLAVSNTGSIFLGLSSDLSAN